MIPNQWYPLYESRKLRAGKPLAVTRLGEKLVLWRDADGNAVCMRDSCPHRNVALSLGKLTDGTLECPYHGFRFAADGTCVEMPCEGREAKIPAGMRAATRNVREAHGLVWMFWGEAGESLPEIPWFDEIDLDHPGAAGASFSWPINFQRSVETNFDAHHTPFVHGATIPGVGARLEPYHVETVGTQISTRGTLRDEDKQTGWDFRIDFKAPCVTYLEFGRLRFAVADCPVDDDSTWRYAVYDQSYVTVPVLRRFVSWLALQLDWKLIQNRQDLKMGETLTPKLPEEHFDRLVHADAGLAAYRKLYRKLVADAQPASASDAELRRVS